MGLAKSYLIIYNFVQFLGWSCILGQLIQHFVAKGLPLSLASCEGVWASVGTLVTIFQSAAVLEIVHSMIRIVKTPVATTGVQVFSRVACLSLAIMVPATHNHWVLSLMLFSWSITEVIRYLFYTLSLVESVPYILGWLRYTLFIVLYPSGVSGEVGTILVSLPFVKETGLFSIAMPNAINFAFNFYYVLASSLVFYVIGLPWLYTYMLGQRKRFIATGGVSQTAKKTQ
eukprot:gene1407-1623_t